MGFFNGIKRAFGFSDDSEQDSDVEVYGSRRTPYVNPFKKEEPEVLEELQQLDQQGSGGEVAVQQAPTPQPVATPVGDDLPEGVFDGLIDIINGNLPDIVKQSIDVETEKNALSQALGPKFHNYVRGMRDSALNAARNEWVEERAKLMDKIKAADDKMAEADAKLAELREKGRVDDVQRRAALTRTHDLENRIATLEAEHEQFDLENKSLVNKVKVMQVKCDDAEKDAEELVRLNAEVIELRKQLAEAQSAAGSVSSEAMEELEKEYKGKMEIANAMVNDMQTKVATKRVEFDKLQADFDAQSHIAEELEKTVATKTDEIKSLRSELEAGQEQIQSLTEELAEAKENLGFLDEIQTELDKVADFKQRKIDEVNELKKQLEDRDSQIAESEKKRAEVELQLASLGDVRDRLKEMDAERVTLLAKIEEVKNANKENERARSAREIEVANRNNDLKEQLSVAAERLAEAEEKVARLQAADSNTASTLRDLREQKMSLVKQVDQLQTSLNDREESLLQSGERLAELSTEVDRLRAENESLKRAAEEAALEVPTITIGDFEESNDEPQLVEVNEITPVPVAAPEPEPEPEPKPAEESLFVEEPVAELEPEPVPEPEPEPAIEPEPQEPEVEQAKMSVVNAIDDMDDIDWLMPTPPSVPAEPAREPAPKAEAKPEPKREHNDRQMSLFD